LFFSRSESLSTSAARIDSSITALVGDPNSIAGDREVTYWPSIVEGGMLLAAGVLFVSSLDDLGSGEFAVVLNRRCKAFTIKANQ
jgi:hypothetical protein